MEKLFRLILLISTFSSCQETKSKIDFSVVNNHTLYEVKKINSINSIYEPCDATNKKYSIKDSLLVYTTAQDGDFRYRILGIKKNNNDYELQIKNTDPTQNVSILNICKIDDKYYSINGKVFIDSIFINTIPHIKQPCKECDNCDDVKKQININEVIPNGYWKIDCKNGNSSINIKDKTAFLEVMFNQIYIDMIEIKRYDSDNGIAYKLKEIPEDKGNFGVNLNWKEYVNDKPIAYVKIIDDNTLYFYWYGFYNKKTQKREFTECGFQQENRKNQQEIILKKCDE
ncbi:hypothetical protein [Flavobacterium hydatis]|uniref:Lipoprotein n=1 Tax=Flavobacterium hydatis TaxID=991 RepID=A0A085ZBH2_FLAHY|nr:hypothetical protein [Flavobacterium hydatis]KFF01786.1 hypothetical protein IW20_25670 [Flavobacterium hydatis]OXA84799.1 hypothetical protein B0A62_25045 [Flavobacterium hydatis]